MRVSPKTAHSRGPAIFVIRNNGRPEYRAVAVFYFYFYVGVRIRLKLIFVKLNLMRRTSKIIINVEIRQELTPI